MSSNKMRWTKPQLIVLSRGAPEESVLTHCKRIGNVGEFDDATNTHQTGCDKPANENCGACQARAGTS